MSSFEGKVIAITGGASGIGLSVAKLLHTRGASISICDLSPKNLEAAPGNLGIDQDDMVVAQCDVRNLGQVQAWVQATIDKFGRLDGAANIAGIFGTSKPGAGLVEDQDEEEWETVIGVNLTGTMHAMKAELKHMRAGGSVVNMSSVAGLRGLPGATAYGVSKHGVIGLTRSCARDYGPKGVRVNCVAPGYVVTPMLHTVGKGIEDKLESAAAAMPIGRYASAEEIANVVAFLLSNEASFVTGSVYSVDGGWNA